jgi:hypothetical protein
LFLTAQPLALAAHVLLQRAVVEPEPRQVRAHLRRGRAGLLYICLQRHHLVKHLPFTSAVATAEALEEHDVVLYTAKKEFDAKVEALVAREAVMTVKRWGGHPPERFQAESVGKPRAWAPRCT